MTSVPAAPGGAFRRCCLRSGRFEGSIGHSRTDELAVMLDTALPLKTTAAALAVEDPGYQDSFVPPGD